MRKNLWRGSLLFEQSRLAASVSGQVLCSDASVYQIAREAGSFRHSRAHLP
jgi:hypothetical protein